MRPGARITAAIEVLEDVLGRHRPISEALSDWGKAHRIAGSGDRAAIGNLVYDALRRRSSIAWAFDADTPRALAIGAAGEALAMSPEAVTQACDGSQHAPQPLSAGETAGLSRPLTEAPPHVQANVPEWLWPSFIATFGDGAVAEGQRLAMRAPTDMRINTLKATREKVAKSLASFGVVETTLSPLGLRVRAPQGPGRTPNLQAEAAFEAGWFEIQDEGSQIASLMAGSGPRSQVLDLCAGGGGKTLAMAANMQNTGQIYAYDSDRHRLKPIFQRLKRAGARNVQVLKAGDRDALMAMGPRFDVVLVDAPCTGTGVWRRRPEAKWRLRDHSVGHRQADQKDVLTQAASLVKPGGVLVYVTCSILADENTAQVAWATRAHPEFSVEPTASVWERTLKTAVPRSADGLADTLLMTPNHHDTDGFFVSVLRKRSA